MNIAQTLHERVILGLRLGWRRARYRVLRQREAAISADIAYQHNGLRALRAEAAEIERYIALASSALSDVRSELAREHAREITARRVTVTPPAGRAE